MGQACAHKPLLSMNAIISFILVIGKRTGQVSSISISDGHKNMQKKKKKNKKTSRKERHPKRLTTGEAMRMT